MRRPKPLFFGNEASTVTMEWWRRSLLWFLGVNAEGVVRYHHGPTGPRLTVDEDGTRFARLTGSANPYGGTEVYPAASGAWTNLPGAPALTGVYEANALTALAGKVVRVRPGYGPAAGEWRFEWVRMGGGTEGGCDHEICVTVVYCDHTPFVGVSVRIIKVATGEYSITYYTDVTGRICICAVDPGDYVVEIGAFYQIRVTVAPDDAEVDVTFKFAPVGASLCINLVRSGCDFGSGAPGATVLSATPPTGWDMLAPDATKPYQRCFVTTGLSVVSLPPTFDFTWVKCDDSTGSGSFDAALGDLCSPPTLTYDVTEDGFNVLVKGCGIPLEGAFVSAAGATGTTGADGFVTLHGTPGGSVGTVTVSKDRFTTQSVTPGSRYGCCEGVEVDLVADSDHVCCGCGTPFSKSWTLTASCGTLTLTYAGAGGFEIPCQWTGCIMVGGTPTFFTLERHSAAPWWRLRELKCVLILELDEGCSYHFGGTDCSTVPGTGGCPSPVEFDATFDAGDDTCGVITFPVTLTGTMESAVTLHCGSGPDFDVANPCAGGFTLTEN